MNLLALDAGNSALKWACFKVGGAPSTIARPPGPILASGALPYGASADEDWIDCLSSDWRGLPVDHCAGAVVADASVIEAIGVAARVSGVPAPQWLRTCARFVSDAVVLDNGYHDPTELGVDRWHGMIGACWRYPKQALVIVTAGTATTIDCVVPQAHGHRFVGGLIAPGLDLMRSSLARGTARLPWVPLDAAPATSLPLGTAQAIATAIVDAQIGLIGRALMRYAAHDAGASGPTRLVVTGGQAERLMPYLPGVVSQHGNIELVREDNLVLPGVALAACTVAPATPMP